MPDQPLTSDQIMAALQDDTGLRMSVTTQLMTSLVRDPALRTAIATNLMNKHIADAEERAYRQDALTRAVPRVGLALGMTKAHAAFSRNAKLNSGFMWGAIFAAEGSKLLTPEDLNELFESHLIVTSSERKHAAVEFSLNPTKETAKNAIRRAEILGRLYGDRGTPVVVSPTPSSELKDDPELQDVMFLQIAP